MSKVGNEYNNEILHIIYKNNHSKLADVSSEIANVINVYNCDVINQMSKIFIMKKNKNVEPKIKRFS
jgi:hypothetical protein